MAICFVAMPMCFEIHHGISLEKLTLYISHTRALCIVSGVDLLGGLLGFILISWSIINTSLLLGHTMVIVTVSVHLWMLSQENGKLEN